MTFVSLKSTFKISTCKAKLFKKYIAHKNILPCIYR